MKKISILLLLAIAVTTIANAQAFDKGTNVLSAGVGLGSSILSYSGANQTPAISLQYERGSFPIGDIGVISLGGYLGFKSYNYDYGSGYKAKWSYTIIGARSAFHLKVAKVPKFDPYGGVMVSYNYLKFKDASGYSTGAYGSAAGFTAYVGAKYYFANKLGAMAELGYGVSYLTIGLSLKF
jgi:hypothetical protein